MKLLLVGSFLLAGFLFVGVSVYGYVNDLTAPGLWLVPALILFTAAACAAEGK